MPRTFTDTGSARPLLDIASYARRGPRQRDRLSPEEIQLIERTVRRTPEVMVKVLSRGGQDMKAVGRHLSYLSRKGDFAIETDDGEEIRGKDAEASLLKDWDLDIQELRPTSILGPGLIRTSPKLVHKVLFSMPPGTPPKKVLAAVKVLAREEFGSRHRYAMVLHTDEPHPHVHVVVKAVSEDGVRLNIRRATLRHWRQQFASRLREQGVKANATERAVRGQRIAPRQDGIFRAMERGALLHVTGRTSAGAAANRQIPASTSGLEHLRMTRDAVLRGWAAAARMLVDQNETAIAGDATRFLGAMAPIALEDNSLAHAVRPFRSAESVAQVPSGVLREREAECP